MAAREHRTYTLRRGSRPRARLAAYEEKLNPR